MVRYPLLLFSAAFCLAAPVSKYECSGMVLAVDPRLKTVTISHAAIPGYMDAMTMAFQVRGSAPPADLHPGDHVAFRLVVNRNASWVENLRLIPFESAERDPALASRLKLLDSATGKPAAALITVGQSVPEFALTDQNNRRVSLSELRGNVVALNFVYTRCPLPDYCFRLSTNFARLEKRFGGTKDLVLLTVSFDPVHDTPEVLARYAQTWKADGARWHFLTGSLAEVDRVCELFGVARWRDDGLFTHSLHTVVIDRDGRMAANIEGNRFTAQELGDLVATRLAKRN